MNPNNAVKTMSPQNVLSCSISPRRRGSSSYSHTTGRRRNDEMTELYCVKTLVEGKKWSGQRVPS